MFSPSTKTGCIPSIEVTLCSKPIDTACIFVKGFHKQLANLNPTHFVSTAGNCIIFVSHEMIGFRPLELQMKGGRGGASIALSKIMTAYNSPDS